jgi:hypothetical protein
MPGISRTDIIDGDFIDAVELKSDGTVTYLTVTVVSTTSGTQTVVVNIASDGEGILFGRDHEVVPGDIVVLSGTSGGAGDGTYTVATVPTNTSLTVTGAIGTSTGGNATFYYTSGSTNVGFGQTKQNITSSNILQQALTDISNHDLLDNEPVGTGVTYSNTRSGSLITQELWINTGNSRAIREVDYTYTGSKVTTEVRKVFSAADGTTVIAQVTLTYSYTGSSVTGTTIVRNV